MYLPTTILYAQKYSVSLKQIKYHFISLLFEIYMFKHTSLICVKCKSMTFLVESMACIVTFTKTDEFVNDKKRRTGFVVFISVLKPLTDFKHL